MNKTFESEATRLHMEALEQLGEITAGLAQRLHRVEMALCAIAEDETLPGATRIGIYRELNRGSES